MKRRLNALAILVLFLLVIILVNAAEDSESINENSETVGLSTINEGIVQEIITKNKETINLNNSNNNNIENPIANETIQKTLVEHIENQERHSATASFGVYLNIVG